MNLFRSKTTTPLSRNSISRSPLRRGLFLIALVPTCLALSPQAQALSPLPDGGYPGVNTAEGTNALFGLTTGTGNTAVGANALFHDTDGSSNTAIGQAALANNLHGDFNTATGVQALYLNTADDNTAYGFQALFRNTTGSNNTATGVQALTFNTTGSFNVATGFALVNNTTGSRNTADGSSAMVGNTSGNSNAAFGYAALLDNSTGFNNTGIGYQALVLSTGNYNTALGFEAGANLQMGDNNIYIGNRGLANESSTIRIGTFQTKTFIAGIRGRTTANANAVPVMIDSAGQLGTTSSSARFKKEIKPMDKASEAILALKPVTFHYKSDSTGAPQFGLIAEEVAKVNPDLVVRDENGEIYTVRYEAVNAMLLNEFLKEHKTVREQKATIAQLKEDFESKLAKQQEQIEALTAGLQKVSAQLEVSKSAPKTVLNKQ